MQNVEAFDEVSSHYSYDSDAYKPGNTIYEKKRAQEKLKA